MRNVNIVVSDLDHGEIVQLCKVLQKNLDAHITFSYTEESVMPLRVKILDILASLGVHSKLKGHQYLKAAIEDCYLCDGALKSMTKELYPEIAKRYKTSSSSVEHTMRSAIDKAWEEADIESKKKIFGYSALEKGKRPSNSIFIASVTDYLLLHNDINLNS